MSKTDIGPSTKELKELEKETSLYDLNDDTDSEDGLTLYWKDMRACNIHQLTEEEEKEYFKNYKEKGDMKAREALIESCMKLVVYFAKKYRDRGIEFADLIQDGNLGLIKAIDKYEPNKKAKFSVYAAWWIREVMGRDIRDHSKLIRIPVNNYDNEVKTILTASDEFFDKNGRRPTLKELSLITKIDEFVIMSIYDSINPVVSLDMKVGEDDDTEYGELVEDKKCVSPEIAAIRMDNKRELLEKIDKLNPMEQKVIKEYYGIDTKQRTLQEIADELGVSRQRISAVQLNCIRKLKVAYGAR